MLAFVFALYLSSVLLLFFLSLSLFLMTMRRTNFLIGAPWAQSARRISAQRRWPRCFCGRAMLRFRERAHATDTTCNECDTTTTALLLLLLLLLMMLWAVHAPGSHRARMRNKQCSEIAYYSRVYMYTFAPTSNGSMRSTWMLGADCWRRLAQAGGSPTRQPITTPDSQQRFPSPTRHLAPPHRRARPVMAGKAANRPHPRECDLTRTCFQHRPIAATAIPCPCLYREHCHRRLYRRCRRRCRCRDTVILVSSSLSSLTRKFLKFLLRKRRAHFTAGSVNYIFVNVYTYICMYIAP